MKSGVPRFLWFALLLVFAVGATSCSSSADGSRILGHWRAERFKIQSLNLPIGPEIVIGKADLHVLEGDIHIPIRSISANGDEVIVDVPAGLGLSFYFEGTDRMYFDVPLGGKIYYQRVKEIQPVAKATPAPGTASLPNPGSPKKPAEPTIQQERSVANGQVQLIGAISNIPGSSVLDLVRQAETKIDENKLADAQSLLMRARDLEGDHPMVDYKLAVLRMRQSDGEAAIHHLNDAFKHGFRAFGLLDANADLAPLKQDVRYEALVSRYR